MENDRCYVCRAETGRDPLSVTLRARGRVFEFLFHSLACAMEFMHQLERCDPRFPPPAPPMRRRRITG